MANEIVFRATGKTVGSRDKRVGLSEWDEKGKFRQLLDLRKSVLNNMSF